MKYNYRILNDYPAMNLSTHLIVGVWVEIKTCLLG